MNIVIMSTHKKRESSRNKMLSYRRDRAAECTSFGQKWKTETGRQFLRTV